MAVTVTATRTSHSYTNNTNLIFGTLALSGTYTTGGFTFAPFSMSGNVGTSPLSGTRVFGAFFSSPTAYTYTATTLGNLTTVKIFSAPGTELANAAALPDASVSFLLIASRV